MANKIQSTMLYNYRTSIAIVVKLRASQVSSIINVIKQQELVVLNRIESKKFSFFSGESPITGSHTNVQRRQTET